MDSLIRSELPEGRLDCSPLSVGRRRLSCQTQLRVGELQSNGVTPDGLGLKANEVGQVGRPGTAKEFASLDVEPSLRPLHRRGFVVAVPHAQGVRNGEPEDREDQIPRADGPSFLQLQATLSS